MAINLRGLLFVSLFLCLNVLFSQEADIGSKHRIAWTKDEYALRYEVSIEREENKKHTLILREFTEEPFIYISLPPGNYRLRVIPYDFRDVPVQGTKWKNFKVLAVTTPNTESSSEPQSQLVMEEQPSFEQEQVKTPKDNTTENQAENADSPKPEKQKDLFAGLFAEGMGYSRYNITGGGGILLGGSLDGKGIGLRLLFVQDAENFIFFEALAHFRMYLSREKIENAGLFLQAEGGIVFFSYEKFEITEYSSFVAGLSAGWRFMMNDWWYIEPFIRGGYPYIFGAGFSTGFRFNF